MNAPELNPYDVLLENLYGRGYAERCARARQAAEERGRGGFVVQALRDGFGDPLPNLRHAAAPTRPRRSTLAEPLASAA
jgi:hypothetical protein